MGGAPISGKLASYLKERPGSYVFVEDIIRDLGETRERVLGGMVNLLGRNLLPGTSRVQTGGPWVYKPNQSSQPAPNNDQKLERSLFEEVGRTKNGSIVLQDEHGKLYKAIELE